MNLIVYLKEKMVYNSISKHDYQQISYIEDSDHDSFKILTGRYSGTVVTYGKIALTEPTDGEDNAVLSFEYTVNESNLDSDETESQEFRTYLGDMLQVVIQEAIEEKNFAIGEKPSDTNSHFKKSYN